MGAHPIFESDFDCLTERMSSRMIGAVAVVGATAVGAANSFYNVDGGHRAVKFSRWSGVQPEIYGEGLHFKLPWMEWPLIYDIRAKPNQIKSETGTKDLQMVNIGLRVLYRPDPNQIAWMAKNIGNDFAEKVLPSLTQETLKSVIARYNATSLLTQRNEVSIAIAIDLQLRARAFKITLDDVAITDTSFSPRFTQSIEQKQIAQQQAQQARYYVEEAKQTKQQKIVAAQGDAESARLIGKSLKENPAYLKLQRIEYGKQISKYVAQGGNKVMLPSNNLLLDIQTPHPQYDKKQ